jgi:hypothetical protein
MFAFFLSLKVEKLVSVRYKTIIYSDGKAIYIPEVKYGTRS